MADGSKKLLTMALVACLIGGLPWGGDRAQADSHSVLRLARGLASDNITVLIGRAIVVESTQSFIEVSVAAPDIADVSPLSDRSIYIFGKARGATTLTLLGENGKLITNVTIKVIPDIAELKQRLKDVLSNEPIEARLTGGSVVLSGIVSGKAKINRAMRLARAYVGKGAINMMTVGGTQQVMLKVRIAEMSRSAAKALGIDSFINGTSGDFGSVLHSGPGVTSLVGPGSAVSGVFEPTGTALLTGFGALGFIAQIGDIGIGITLNALEEKGFSRTLAEPNLVALSGNQASFLAGQDVPIPQINEEGELVITFKSIGVGLNFTPTVLDDDLINLEISTEVSSIVEGSGIAISVGADPIPIFNVRRATTAIELRDGQSFAIAGLLEDKFTDSVNQFPWLGDIPVLGSLFRSMRYARGETELVIIVTVHLVVPVNEEELSLPHDNVRIPNEFELFLLGQTDGAGAPGMVQSQGFDGDFGYVVE
ncbi:MAG: type II and III secretion system protein family protein [Thermohalobaculum sp.]